MGDYMKENYFATRCSILFSILAISLCAICKNMRVLLLHFDAGYYVICLTDTTLRRRFDDVTQYLIIRDYLMAFWLSPEVST